MRRFFIEPEAIQEDSVILGGEIAHHIGKVLRLNQGDIVTVCTGDGAAYVVELQQFRKESVTGVIVDRVEQQRETNVELVLYQGMPKADKLEMIIQKCTELGVSAVIPVETGRSVVRLDSGKAEKKLERWQKIAHEASQQSKRVTVPKVGPYLKWNACLEQLQQSEGITIVFWEDEQTYGLKEVLNKLPEKPGRINLVVGPEGGLSETEVEQLRQAGAVSASLGKRILRTETAGMAGVSMILYQYDELG